jgi:hypothetical protein
MKALQALLLGAIGLGATAVAAEAGPREDVLSALQHCASIPDDQAWLSCYFGSAQPMETHLGQAAAAAPVYGVGATAYSAGPAPAFGVGAVRSAPAAPSGPPPMPKYKSGLYSGMFGAGHPIVANMRMSSYAFDGTGHFVVTLSDGQVWRQLDGDSALAHWNKPANTYVVNVGQGALGTYNLMVNADGNSFKAERVK